MHLGCLLPGRSPRIATTFQPSWATLGSMGIRPDDSKTALGALLRRHALLAAYLDAVNRIDGPNHRRRAAELRLVHRPRRDLPACRVVQFPQRAPSRAGEASPTERPASERFGAKQRGVVQTSNPTGWKLIERVMFFAWSREAQKNEVGGLSVRTLRFQQSKPCHPGA
jgi:hypothetical protein